ncbi:hypothetical protein K492DRAFT_179399 [Lichtheimia hyalospora FSU 10163]|nr:hypothetical protein K492DRAFT_179399 [Lichtheimia hyalospora FSU 10163]
MHEKVHTSASVLLVAIVFHIAALVECTSSDDESTVNRIRADESHLRALVVILSLTGGLAIAFGLGAGICLYWHCRAFRRRKLQKRQLNQQRDEEVATPPMQESQQQSVDLPAIIVTSPSENITPLTAIENSHTAPSSPSLPPMTTTATVAQPSPPPPPPSQPVIPTPPDTSTVREEPGPSAPSAKELLIGQDSNNGNAHADDSAIVFHSECCCQHPVVPPPAYSPRSYQPLMLDPDTAPAIAYVNRHM